MRFLKGALSKVKTKLFSQARGTSDQSQDMQIPQCTNQNLNSESFPPNWVADRMAVSLMGMRTGCDLELVFLGFLFNSFWTRELWVGGWVGVRGEGQGV